MSFLVKKAGLQTSIQAGPFARFRHIGMPAAGAADSLSLALANRLVGQPAACSGLEVTLSNALIIFEENLDIAVTGAASFVKINGVPKKKYETLQVQVGDCLEIGPAEEGCRSYLAFSLALATNIIMGTKSTYMPAKIGGFQGQAMSDGDRISFEKTQKGRGSTKLVAPQNLRLFLGRSHLLRFIAGPEFELLNKISQQNLTAREFTISQRGSRMGLALENNKLSLEKPVHMNSSATFPGTIQLPPSGYPFLLGCDAQTSGGYPRIAQIITADRHIIGQLRGGDRIKFVRTSNKQAQAILQAKIDILSQWVPDIVL